MSCTYNSMISKSEYIDKLNWSFWRSAANTPVVFKLQWCINTVFTHVCTAYFAKLETNAPSVSQQWWHRQEGDQKSSWQIAITSPTCSLWNFLSPWCVHVCVRLCYVYQTVCVSACVHGFPRGCESTCVHMCVVCFNASATCGNLKLWGWNRLPCWGLFSVVPSFSAFFFPFCVWQL